MSNGLNRILIIGRGFIAEALAANLARHGVEVLRPGAGAPSPRPREHAGIPPAESEELEALVRRCNRVALLPDLSQENGDSWSQLDEMILGVRWLFEYCARHRRGLLFTSPGDAIDRDPAAPLGPPSPLALANAVAVRYAEALGTTAPETLHVRLFGIYGPGMRGSGYGGALGVLLDRLASGQSLAVGDTGNAVRAFCHVDDAAEGLARLLLAPSSDPVWANKMLDLGRDEPVTVSDLVLRLSALSGLPVQHERDGDVIAPAPVSPLLANPRPLVAATGFHAAIDLDGGLAGTLAAMGRLAETPAQVLRPLPNIRPLFDCDSDLGGRIQRILVSGQVTNGGPRQQALERRLAEWLGVAESVVVSNGADALSLALAALPAAPGAKAILPSYTFIATLNAVRAAGLTPVFCDIDPETFTLCPQALERLLAKTSDVAWVIPVAVFGIPAELAKLCPLAEAVGARVLYDNCHGFGSEVDGARVLSGPLVQTISMHATKVLPGIEGGILLSDDADLLARFRQLRNHGIAADPLQSTVGMNTKLDEVRAEITLAQLAGIDGALARRRGYGERLRGFIDRAGLGDVFRLQRIPEGVRSNFQNHGILCPLPDQRARDVVVADFQARGIGARPYFHPALHRLPAFSDQPFDLPHTENVWTRWVCLPLHARMAAPDLERLEQSLLEIGQKLRADDLTFNPTAAAERGQHP